MATNRSTNRSTNRKKREALAAIPTVNLKCRFLRTHPFDFVEKVENGHAFGTLVVWKCDCGMVRHDVINRLGQLAYRRYFPPENYTIPRELRPAAEAMRLEFLTRL